MGLFFQSETTVIILFRSTHKTLTNNNVVLRQVWRSAHTRGYMVARKQRSDILQPQFPFCLILVFENDLLLKGALLHVA